MRWLVGIGWTLAAIGLVIAIWAGAMDVTKATEVPDPTYSYVAITKTISVVNVDLVRVQILWFVAGIATILLGAIMATVGYLGLRLGLDPAPESTSEEAPSSAIVPEPRPVSTPEEVAEASERDKHVGKIFLIGGLIVAVAVLVLALIAHSADLSASSIHANNLAQANASLGAADNLSSEAVNGFAANVADATKAAAAKPTPSAIPQDDDESGDVDEPEMPAPSATSPTDDASLNSN